MIKKKQLFIILFVVMIFFMLTTISNAAVEVTRDIYSNNGSMKFSFSGLTLDATHEYEFGLTASTAQQVEKWFAITDYTTSSAVINITTPTEELREVINATDKGYITIKDKTDDKIILEPYAVDLKIPYLQLTNYTVIENGKEFETSEGSCIQIYLRNASNSEPYYQYEKITDENLIKKYKEIKANNGDYSTLQNMIKTTVPTSNWKNWEYWNGHTSSGIQGYGFTQETVKAPDTGLYYMWLYFSGNSIKDLYGCILVDNLQPDIALESISLPKTKTVELGKTLTLIPTFNPSGATNKIVTWESSDETVATIDNAGKITPKKEGSTIITVTSQDGNKKATCTVTVVKESNDNNSNNNSSNNNSSNNNSSNEDDSTATGKLPQTGIGITLISVVSIIVIIGTVSYLKYFKYRDI